MRVTIPLPNAGPINWHALENERTFLYRRVADESRELLFVEALYDVKAPQFSNGSAREWYFGHILYDLVEELEPLRSRHPVRTGLPWQQWSVPRWVIEWNNEGVFLHVFTNDEAPGRAFCERLFSDPKQAGSGTQLEWEVITPRERYLQQARRLLEHIQRGDIYEVNYCIERVAQANDFDPFSAFEKLQRHSKADLAGFHRNGEYFALCASPERFLSFNRARVIAQPMKGTRPRSLDPVEDARLARELAGDAKERSENIMALDVARHDLSRVAASGSVHVEELCAVRPHANVHQMTSTVAARIREGCNAMDVVRAAFPMASMTGAPKFRAMQLIDAMEDQRRGLFSGTLGFFAPDGTADLNVVIRTLFYDSGTGEASLITGSALTAACDPEKEWEECELKARSVINALQ